MARTLFTLLFMLTLLVATSAAEEVPDSLLIPEYIQRIHLKNPHYALQLLDAAEKRQVPRLPAYRIDLLRALCYEVTDENLLKEKYARRALENDSVQTSPKLKLRMQVLLASTLESSGKYEESIRLCIQAVELARQQKNVAEEGRVLFVMGCNYKELGQWEKAMESFQASAQVMESSNDVRVLAQLSATYGEQMNLLMARNLFDLAIETGRRREKLVMRMAPMPGPPAGYIDQQQAYLYSKMAYLLQKVGRTAEAADYARQFRQTDYAQTLRHKNEIIPYLLEAHRYKEVVQLNDSMSHLVGNDTIGYEYSVVLDRYAQAYRGLKLYDKADDYQRRLTALQDSLFVRGQQSQAQEYATIFRLNEKELQLAEARATAQQRIFLIIIITSILVLASALLGVIWQSLRKTRKRNRIAVRQIDELLAQREELRKAFKALEAQSGTEPRSSGPASSRDDLSPNGEDTANEKTAEHTLFIRMDSIVAEQKLFLKPGFGRDELAEICRIGKRELPRLLQQYADADNANDYLNRLRVEYSVRLMKERPQLSINGIAQEANFNSRATFYRAFTKQFGLSPMQYMETQKQVESSPKAS